MNAMAQIGVRQKFQVSRRPLQRSLTVSTILRPDSEKSLVFDEKNIFELRKLQRVQRLFFKD